MLPTAQRTAAHVNVVDNVQPEVDQSIINQYFSNANVFKISSVPCPLSCLKSINHSLINQLFNQSINRSIKGAAADVNVVDYVKPEVQQSFINQSIKGAAADVNVVVYVKTEVQ